MMKSVIFSVALIVLFLIMGAYVLFEGLKVQSAFERMEDLSREIEKITEERQQADDRMAELGLQNRLVP